jgi:hypothetical protein
MAQDIAEIPPPPRRRTLSYYVVLMCLVAPLWSSVLVSWAFVINSLRSGRIWSFAWPGRILFAVTLCEVSFVTNCNVCNAKLKYHHTVQVFFSVYHCHLAHHISGPSPYGPGELLEIQAAYRRLLKAGLSGLPENGDDEESDRPGSPEETIIQLERDDPRAVDFRNSLRTWFCKVPWSSVRLHEVQKWLYWSIFNTDLPPLDQLSQSHRAVLDEALDLLQKRSGSIIQEGSNPKIQPMRLTIDSVNIMWRPLTYYAIIFSINWCLRVMCENKWGASYGYYDGIECVSSLFGLIHSLTTKSRYLIRIPKHWDPVTGPRPIVFIHGLGLGFLQYNFSFTHLFETFSDRPLLIPLQPQISQNIFHPQFLKPMTRHQMADRLARLLDNFGWVQLDGTGNAETSEESEDERQISSSLLGKRGTGVTMMSHSK